MQAAEHGLQCLEVPLHLRALGPKTTKHEVASSNLAVHASKFVPCHEDLAATSFDGQPSDRDLHVPSVALSRAEPSLENHPGHPQAKRWPYDRAVLAPHEEIRSVTGSGNLAKQG